MPAFSRCRISFHAAARPVSLLAVGFLTACGGSDDLAALPTLDGAVPSVIAHRGLPGLYPEETQTYGGPAQYLADRTNPGDKQSVHKSLVVHGEGQTGDWSITRGSYLKEAGRWA